MSAPTNGPSRRPKPKSRPLDLKGHAADADSALRAPSWVHRLHAPAPRWLLARWEVEVVAAGERLERDQLRVLGFEQRRVRERGDVRRARPAHGSVPAERR